MQVFVQGVVAHLVVRVFGSGLEAPAGRELLFEGDRQRRHVVAAPRAVAVERIDGCRQPGFRHAAPVVIRVFRIAVGVVSQHLERRTERVDFPDIVERCFVSVDDVVVCIPACGVRVVSGHQVGRRSGLALGAEVQVGKFGAEAVPVVDLVERTDGCAAVAAHVVASGVCPEFLLLHGVCGLLFGMKDGTAQIAPSRGVEVPFPAVQGDVAARVIGVLPAALRGAHRKGALHAVFALLAERDADDAARGIGIVVGAGCGDDLDFLNLLGAQRAQVGRQLLGFEPQFAVVHKDLRAAFAVDRYALVVHPDTRSPFEQLGTILSDGRRGVGHIHDETVGFAAYRTGFDDDLLHGDGCGLQGVLSRVGRYRHLCLDSLVAEVLDCQAVGSGGSFQCEGSVVVGCRACNLPAGIEQYDGRIGDGTAVRIDDLSGRRHRACSLRCLYIEYE